MKQLASLALLFTATATPALAHGQSGPELISSLPYVIDSCGSYALAAGMVGVVGQHGIEITASDVVLDLNGFTLVGLPGAFDGIHSSADRVTVRNGTVRSWSDGISLEGDDCEVVSVNALDNNFAGISLGEQGRVERCYVDGQDSVAGVGIRVSSHGLIERCIAFQNRTGLGGIGDGGSLRSCVSVANTLHGIGSAGTSDGWSYIGNSSGFNDGSGLSVASRSMVLHNAAIVNGSAGTDAGIEVTGSDSFVGENLLYGNQTGIETNFVGDHVVARNVCITNTLNFSVPAGNDLGTVVGSIVVAGPWDNLGR